MNEITFSIIFEYVQQYYVCFASAIVFLLFMKLNTQISVRARNLFIRAIIAVLLFALSECCERLLGRLTFRTVARTVLSAVNYSLKIFSLYFIVAISARHWSLKRRLINSIPAILNALICMISIPTGIVFSFHANNSFARGPLGLLPFAVGGFYLLEYAVHGIIQIRKSELLDGIICIANTISVLLVALFEYVGELQGLLPNTAMISILFYYLTLLLGRYSHDELTAMNLRNRFYADVDRISRHTFIVSIDLNGLKQVNDQYGHAAGDQMLVTFSEAILGELSLHARAYRTGGDEFAVLFETGKRDEVEAFILSVRMRLAGEGSDITFSAGIDAFGSSAEFESAFLRADMRMYEEKRAYKEKMAGKR